MTGEVQQIQEVAEQVRPVLGLWIAFSVGVAVHVLKVAGAAVRTKRFKSRISFFLFYWDAIGARTLLQCGIFWLWISNPDFLQSALGKFGVQLNIELPVAKGTALLFGYFGDSIIKWVADKIPWFRKELPRLNEGQTIAMPAVNPNLKP